MLLHDDVVTDGEPESGSFSGRLRCEERVEHLFFYFRWNTRAVIPNPDFHTIAKALGRGSKGWHVLAAIRFRLALDRRIEAVSDQVQERPRDVMREDISLPCRRIQGPLHGDVEALFLGPCPVPGEIKALLNASIDINNPLCTRAFARVQQHVLDDGIRALAVL